MGKKEQDASEEGSHMEEEVEHFAGTSVLGLASVHIQHNTVQHKYTNEVEKSARTAHQRLI